MRTLLRIGFINLRRDRVVLAMVFVLPIVFFSIFAVVFGGQQDPATSRIRIAVVDEDRSEVSARIVAGLQNEKGLRARTTADEAGKQPTLDRRAAEREAADKHAGKDSESPPPARSLAVPFATSPLHTSLTYDVVRLPLAIVLLDAPKGKSLGPL